MKHLSGSMKQTTLINDNILLYTVTKKMHMKIYIKGITPNLHQKNAHDNILFHFLLNASKLSKKP